MPASESTEVPGAAGHPRPQRTTPLRRLRAALPLLALIAAGAALYVGGAREFLAPDRLVAEHERLQALIAQFPVLSRLAMVTAVTVGVATGMPGSILLVLAAGFLFGIVEGTLWTAIGLVAGSLLLYLAARRAFRSGRHEPPQLVRRIRASYLRNPFSYTLFLRLVPAFPFGMTTLALAWLRCPLGIFVAASALGGTVMLVFETAIGAGLADHLATGRRLDFAMVLEPHIALPLVVLGLMALLPVALNWRHRRKDA